MMSMEDNAVMTLKYELITGLCGIRVDRDRRQGRFSQNKAALFSDINFFSTH